MMVGLARTRPVAHGSGVGFGRAAIAWMVASAAESNEIGKDSSSLNERCCGVSNKCANIDLDATYYCAMDKPAEEELCPCLATQAT
jgi:hypothetical protein